MSYRMNLRRLDLGTLATGKTVVIAGGVVGTGFGSIRVYQVNATAAAATVVTPFSRPAGGTGSSDVQVGGALTFALGVPLILDDTEQPWVEARPGESLVFSLSVGTTFTGSIWYGCA